MNIKQAKEQIRYAVKAYLTRNEFGELKIPVQNQRPIFLMGAPGIGKTAIMEQIAHELGIGLVSYSMTHHTRQSALGLPFIEKKNYGGIEYNVSEYTMSEIIAAVYDCIEEGGTKEGILFLDEINCVSETLAPSMLQFLQFKTFGRHKVPDGWIIVTAGNPPEYNNSVREFDIVTWDRLKRIDVEADFDTWKEYAYLQGVHPSVMTYLEIRKDDFYRIETTVDGKSFVTARGWVDLSDMIYLYEQNHFPVNEALIRQYLQNPSIAKSFSIYYDLFNKYRSDYQIDAIASGKADDEIKNRAQNAKFDERISLLGLLLDSVANDFHTTYETEQMLVIVMNEFKSMKVTLARAAGQQVTEVLQQSARKLMNETNTKRRSNSISTEQAHANLRAVNMIEELSERVQREDISKGIEAFLLLKKKFDEENSALKKNTNIIKKRLENIFNFVSEVYPDGREMLILVTELTINPESSHFIGRYGCDSYFQNNRNLLFYERQKELLESIYELKLDDTDEKTLLNSTGK